MSIGYLGFGQSATNQAVAGSQAKTQARDDQKENTARDARSAFVMVTTGVGSTVGGSVQFDCNYIEEPHFTSGVSLLQAPDASLYHLPLGQAGIYSWITEPQVAGTTDPVYWIGAELYFEVQVKLLENQDISKLASDPAQCVLEHHLSFNGLAMKKLPSAVSDSQNDSTVTPRTPFLAATAG